MVESRALAAICVGATVCGADEALGLHVPPIQILILIFIALVDARPASPIALVNVAALDHEFVDDSMEGRFGVGEAIVLAGAQLAKAAMVLVLRKAAEEEWCNVLLTCPRGLIREELDGQTTERPLTDAHVEEAARSRGGRHVIGDGAALMQQ